MAGGVSLSIGEIDQAIVLGDRDRLYQLVLNLVSNAVKYHAGGRQGEHGPVQGEWLGRLVVTDTGIGIPPEELPHVFERFYRVDKARTRSQGGPGWGWPSPSASPTFTAAGSRPPRMAYRPRLDLFGLAAAGAGEGASPDNAAAPCGRQNGHCPMVIKKAGIIASLGDSDSTQK